MKKNANGNPYQPSNDAEGASSADMRFVYLFLPPLIPLVVHLAVRQFIPSTETMHHFAFQLGAIIVAWVWTDTMIHRLELPLLKASLVSCGIWGAVVASSVGSPIIIDWILAFRGPIR